MINRGLLGCELVTMTEEIANVLITLVVMEEQGINSDVEEKLRLDPGFNIIKSRLDATGFKASPCLIALLSFISNGIPGRLVMWSYTLACMQSEKNKTITLSLWVEEFDAGIPSDAAYNSVWDSQKIERTSTFSPDNAYDVADHWPKMLTTVRN